MRLPWWPACQCRGLKFSLWSVKIPHAMEQLNLCTNTEPTLWSPRTATIEAGTLWSLTLQQEKPPQWEACTSQQIVAPTLCNQRKPMYSNEDPMQPKIKNKLQKKRKEIMALFVQSLSHMQLCNPRDCSTSGFPVHCLLEFAQNSCPLSQWCCLTISSSANAFSFCLQSFPASWSFPIMTENMSNLERNKNLGIRSLNEPQIVEV